MKFVKIFVVLVFVYGCGQEQIVTPKPRLYPRIDFPDRQLNMFDEEYCKMSFDYPDYFSVSQDKYFFDGKPLDPCWFDLVSKQINCTVHCSYIPIENNKHFEDLVEDVFRLAAKHNTKANYRKEEVIDNSNDDVYGLTIEMSGPVASPYQFFVTDSTKHFMRASVYFNAKVNSDSIAPVFDFVKEDLHGMIQSFKWKE